MRQIALTAALIMAAASPALAADSVEGDWLTHTGSGKIRIAPCAPGSARMCGAVFWLRDPADAKATDINNPDPALKKRPILGITMIRDLSQTAPGRWTGGHFYDPKTGKTYDGKISLNPNGTLKVEGCILMVCKAQTWKRS